MIELLVIIAYLLPALSVYRRAGYVWNQKMLNGHEFQSICDVCMPDCKNCYNDKSRHTPERASYYGCHNYEPEGRLMPFHLSSLFVALPFALLWPITLICFGVAAVNKMRGVSGTFLKPPPRIESREEKTKRRLAETEAELKDTNKRLRELGIEL